MYAESVLDSWSGRGGEKVALRDEYSICHASGMNGWDGMGWDGMLLPLGRRRVTRGDSMSVIHWRAQGRSPRQLSNGVFRLFGRDRGPDSWIHTMFKGRLTPAEIRCRVMEKAGDVKKATLPYCDLRRWGT